MEKYIRCKKCFSSKKDTYTYTSETVSNSEYFRLYLIGEDKEEKGIYISKEDYERISEKQVLCWYISK